MKAAVTYTAPRLVKGTKPTHIPKGSTIEKEWAKNVWYVNYSYNGKQHRVKENLNRIKDHKDKAYQAEVLLESVKQRLENSYNPEQPEQYFEELSKQTISLAEAVNNYIEDLKTHARKNTVKSYYSKLRYLVTAYPNKQLKDVTTRDIEKYIHSKIHSTEPAKINMYNKVVELQHPIKWTPDTVKAARRIFTTFFYWCMSKDQKYITFNPMQDVDRKRIKSENVAKDRHIPYTEEDLQTLMNYLDENDKPTAFFCRFIYSTCLRPAEISQLKIININLSNKKIIVPISAMKNSRKETVDILDIEPNFLKELEKLNLDHYPPQYFLTGKDTPNIVGEISVGTDKPYKQLVNALKKLNLHGKGYCLYSFKHTSNIRRFKAGWTLIEIMKANRHSSIAMTEKYLKKITNQTDISDKPVPKI